MDYSKASLELCEKTAVSYKWYLLHQLKQGMI